MARGSQTPFANLRFPATIELGSGLVQKNDARAPLHSAQSPCQSDALPLPSREIGTPVISTCQSRIEAGKSIRARFHQSCFNHWVRRTVGRNVVTQRK